MLSNKCAAFMNFIVKRKNDYEHFQHQKIVINQRDIMSYNPDSLIWDTASSNSSGSMPIGNGDIGLNVWVEESGDLVFYISKTDTWDENARLLKLGRIRISLFPKLFDIGTEFRQELDLSKGVIHIDSSTDKSNVSIRVWVDANNPVIHIEVASSISIESNVFLELWRNEKRAREGSEGQCDVGLLGPDQREHVYPDTIISAENNELIWCHRNKTSCWSATLEHQNLADYIRVGKDPLLNRTFGALVKGNGLIKVNDRQLAASNPQKQITISVYPFTAQTASLDEWIKGVYEQAKQSDAISLRDAFSKHTTWWESFWQRSWIKVSGTPEAEKVSQGYNLQRFINACGGRGKYPIKFNGSIFTVDAIEEGGEIYDADYRRWGGGYWFQNTRLLYWSMIMSGDFDWMESWFKMYLDALDLAKFRAKTCFGIDNAAMFPETMTFWGTFLNSNYGYDRNDLQNGLSENKYIRRYWQGLLELIAVLLDLYSYSGDEKVLNEKILILAPAFLNYYYGYYTMRDDESKMLLKPSQSLETWHNAVNPAPDIAGLKWVLDGLLAIPSEKIPNNLRKQWQEYHSILPGLPTRSYFWEKRKEIIPALQYDDCMNFENPALYAIFPYRLFGVGKPDIEVGISTFAARTNKATGGWYQDAIQAAMLGLTDEAKSAVVKNFSTFHEGSRFPAFWGPNFDWIPDQDHGSVASIALQRMLMQADNGKIYLFPAWPKDWNVDFKLYAPDQTVVKGSLKDGVIEELSVIPEGRTKDIEIINKADFEFKS